MIQHPFTKEIGIVTRDTTLDKARVLATPYGKSNDYILLQPFTVAPIIWEGVSLIHRKFQITAPGNLSIVRLPTKPANVNFCPCIFWRVSEGVGRRYKLWDNVGERLYAPLYNGEVFPSTFILEIWNTLDETDVTLTTSLTILVSSLSHSVFLCGDGGVETDANILSGGDYVYDSGGLSVDYALGDYWLQSGLDTVQFVNVGDLTPPEIPTLLTAEAINYHTIDVSWTDNSIIELGFKLERKITIDGTWVEIAVLAADVTTYSDDALDPETNAYYRVRAYNDDGNSGYSNEADATTPAITPLDIPDCFLWWDADALDPEIVGNPTINVEHWPDLSPNGNDGDATGVLSARPTYEVGVQNGYPSVKFSKLFAQSIQRIFTAAQDQPNTILLLAKMDNIDADISFFYDGQWSWVSAPQPLPWYRHTLHQDPGFTPPRLYAHAGENNLYATDYKGAFKLFVTEYNGASSRLRINGVTVAENADVGVMSMGGIKVGAQFNGDPTFLEGYISVVLMYTRILTPEELGILEELYITRLGI